jgi:DNA-binding protein HU-beta
MYKTEVIRKISRQTRLSQRDVADVVKTYHRTIQDALAHDESVQFPGFGTFYTRERPASHVRSFRDGTSITIPTMRVAAFRVGDVLKRAVRRPKLRRRLFKLS